LLPSINKYEPERNKIAHSLGVEKDGVNHFLKFHADKKKNPKLVRKVTEVSIEELTEIANNLNETAGNLADMMNRITTFINS
jgi:hypothetical protein